MQLQSETTPGFNTVTAYGADYVEINQVAYRHAVYFAPEGDIHEWAVAGVDEITANVLQKLAQIEAAPIDPMDFLDGNPGGYERPADAPEVVIIGTGAQQVMLPHSATRALLQMGVGIEAMSTQAAARTYNILMSEGRRVVVALLPCKESE